ncbi:MAG TPA: hypothetical protein VGP64_01005 [Polyangia bacterium]
MKILPTLSFACALALFVGASAAAQVPPAAPPPAAPAEPTLGPGAHVATGQAPVVGGNAAGARERALEDAIRQVVDQALAELIDPQTRATQAKALRALEAKARSFVGSYRTLEEGELNGIYSVRIQAEVDLVALRRKVDRWTNPASGPPPPPLSAPALALRAGEGATPDFIAKLGAALSAVGVRAHGESAGSPPSGGPLATLAVTARDEGALRGTGRVSVACQAAARFAGAPLPERAAAARAFAETPEAAHAACLGRLAGALAPELASALGGAVASSGGDLPILTIDADVVEPAAVSALLKSVRAVGAVSAADLVRVGGGHAEIRARTRSAPAPLAAALSRDADAMISLSDVQTAGGVIRLRARLRAPAAETGSATP